MENSKAMGLWWELVNLMDNQNAVMVSQKTLSEFFGASRQTINSWTKWLEENSLIDIFKVGTANVYAVNAAIISDQLVTQKQHFALFNARVVAEKSEQTKKIQKKHYSVAQQVIRQHNIFGGIDEITSEFEKKP
jgi:DNA-binding XRE family transcriptional regulator